MDIIGLTRKTLSLQEVLTSFPHLPEKGARIWFEGIVRNEAEGRIVRGIFYEAYEKMAKQELEKIKTEAKQRWPLCQIGIIHRVGKLKVGETSLIVVVETPHRKEGFQAIQYLIDALKQRVPIWKKESYETGDTQWL